MGASNQQGAYICMKSIISVGKRSSQTALGKLQARGYMAQQSKLLGGIGGHPLQCACSGCASARHPLQCACTSCKSAKHPTQCVCNGWHKRPSAASAFVASGFSCV